MMAHHAMVSPAVVHNHLQHHGETGGAVHGNRGITGVLGDLMPCRHEMRCEPAEVGRQIVSVGGVKWAKRVMALTKSELCFSKVGSDLKVDFIPCHEITAFEGLQSPAAPAEGTKARAEQEGRHSQVRLKHRASLTHSMTHMSEYKTVNLKTLSRGNSDSSLSSAPSDVVVSSEAGETARISHQSSFTRSVRTKQHASTHDDAIADTYAHAPSLYLCDSAFPRSRERSSSLTRDEILRWRPMMHRMRCARVHNRETVRVSSVCPSDSSWQTRTHVYRAWSQNTSSS